jgi:hypothetical protein
VEGDYVVAFFFICFSWCRAGQGRAERGGEGSREEEEEEECRYPPFAFLFFFFWDQSLYAVVFFFSGVFFAVSQ